MMDSFLAAANDLDKLLDEFEQNEEEADNLYNQNAATGESLQQPTKVEAPQISSRQTKPDTEFALDLSEADFGPAVLNSSLTLNSILNCKEPLTSIVGISSNFEPKAQELKSSIKTDKRPDSVTVPVVNGNLDGNKSGSDKVTSSQYTLTHMNTNNQSQSSYMSSQPTSLISQSVPPLISQTDRHTSQYMNLPSQLTSHSEKLPSESQSESVNSLFTHTLSKSTNPTSVITSTVPPSTNSALFTTNTLSQETNSCSLTTNTLSQSTNLTSVSVNVSMSNTPQSNLIRHKSDLQNGDIHVLSRSPKRKEITPLLPSEIETQYTPLSQFPLPKNVIVSNSKPVIYLPDLPKLSGEAPSINGLMDQPMDTSMQNNRKTITEDSRLSATNMDLPPYDSDTNSKVKIVSTQNAPNEGGVSLDDGTANSRLLNNQDCIPNKNSKKKEPSEKITNVVLPLQSKVINVNCNSNLDDMHKIAPVLNESQPNLSQKKAGFGNLANVVVTDADLEQLGSPETTSITNSTIDVDSSSKCDTVVEDTVTMQLTNELASMDPFYNPSNQQTLENSNEINDSDILSNVMQPSVDLPSNMLVDTTPMEQVSNNSISMNTVFDISTRIDSNQEIHSDISKTDNKSGITDNESFLEIDPRYTHNAHNENIQKQNKEETNVDLQQTGGSATEKSTISDAVNANQLDNMKAQGNQVDNTEDLPRHHPPLIKAKGHPVTSYGNQSVLPIDPPSYHDVINSRQSNNRNSLTLNFEQPGQRKPSPQALQPSPIIDRVSDAIVAEEPNNDLTAASEVAEVVPATQSTRAGSSHESVTRLVDPESGISVLPNGFGIEDGNSEWLRDLVGELSEEDLRLGNVAPEWIPDGSAPSCMKCNLKFTFRKRRHHCRACGKVFCASCCNVRVRLKYMEQKESRVCLNCLNTILRAQAIQRMRQPASSPDPRNPSEYCSTVPPYEQAREQTTSPVAPTVMVPVSKSSLRRPVADGSQKSKGSKRVHFSDGLNPGDELVEEPVTSVSRSSRTEGASIVAEGLAATMSGRSRRQLSKSSKRSLIPKDGVSLPPVIIATETKGEYVVEENPNVERLMPELRGENPNPVVFVLNKNLFVLVKIIDLNCCVNRTCWCFSTKGMPTVGQDELVIILECTPDEKSIPRDMFVHFNHIYHEASKGNTINDMSHSLCGDNFLGSRQHGGFLFLKATFQCLQKLILPEAPYLFGVLLQKWETPWAKVFPLRLMLRLGAEFRYYPCPLMSVRGRKPVYGEIGHTIMNLLADFKNYQYMLPQIQGITIHMQKKETQINFPNSKYDEIMKVINNSNEHVMALSANFSTDADSHLVCIQNEMAGYQTQAINIQNKPRQVTGASFVVFNGALKASTGLTAKSSIVEDGVMVQIQPDMMTTFRQHLREMKDFRIPCGAIGETEPEEVVIVKWIEETRKVNQGVKSPIDGRSMEGVDNIRIHHGTDFMGKTRAIRWTEVFFLESNEAIIQHLEPVDLSRLAETLATACCVALIQHLDALKESGMAKIALRVTVDAERVGYEAGSNGKSLPASYMNSLDNEMIPVLHNAVSQFEDGPVVIELIFHIID